MRSADGCALPSSMIDIEDLPSHTANENQRVLIIIAGELSSDQRAWRLDAANAIWREEQSTKRDGL
jgi:hypothetical protein